MKLNKQIIKIGLKTMKNTLDKNSPKILAALGIGFGTGAVVFAVKGTVRAVEIVNEKQEEKQEPLTKKEIVQHVWKEYVPVVGLTVASAACIVGSVHISARRLAVMTAAYTMSEDSLKKYKDKVHEVLGDKKEEEIRGAIQQDAIDANPPSEAYVKDTGNGETLCRDSWTGQYFYSNADAIKRAVNDTNNLLLHDYYVSYDDLAMEMGVEPSNFGSEFGWNIQDGELIELSFTTELSPDDTPILVVDYLNRPKPNFKHYEL